MSIQPAARFHVAHYLPVALGLVVAVGILSACNGGAVLPSSPTNNCTTTTTSSATISAATIGTAQPLASLGSCSASITLQAGTTGAGTMTASSGTNLPVAMPNPLPTTSAGAGMQTIMVQTLSFPAGATLAMPGSPALTFTLASTTGCSTFYEVWGGASTNPTGTPQTWVIPATGVSANGTTVTFPAGELTGITALGSPSIATLYYIVLTCTS